MKINLSPSRFYLSNITFYTCLLTSPLSAAIEPLNTSEEDRSDEWLGIAPTKAQKPLNAANKGHLDIAESLEKQGDNINAAIKQVNSQPSNTSTIDSFDECFENDGSNQEKEKCQQDNINNRWLALAKKGNKLHADKLRKQHQIEAMQVKDEHGNNALHLACLESGSVAMVTWLLDMCKLSIETKGYEQKTPFLCAVGKKQLGIAKLLRQRGADIHTKDEYGRNALHLACYNSGSVDMVTWLLDECKIGIETKAGKYEKKPFLYAAQKGQLAITKLLRQQGANTNAKDKKGNNALHYACLYSGNEAMVTWLLDICKITLESQGQNQMTSFLCAAYQGHLAIAELLRQRGADINATDKEGKNALHYACLFSGSITMVTWLYDVCKIDIETKDYYQKTPFLCAAQKGQLAIAKLLNNEGANINAKDKDGNNALHVACLWSKSKEMVTWLLDKCKIDIETKGFAQRTPFLCAAEKGHLAIVKLLKQQGANINAKDTYENNALHLACCNSGSVDMVTWLLDVCHIYINSKGRYQYTPFLCAVEKGQLKIAELLRKRGANIHGKSNSDKKALSYAMKYSSSKKMINYLQKLGLS